MKDDTSSNYSTLDALLSNPTKINTLISKIHKFNQGFKLYKEQNYLRPGCSADTIYTIGSMKLLKYSNDYIKNSPILLIIPSLINKYYILDLTEDNSLVKNLSKVGINTYLIEWSDPLECEIDFGLEEYIVSRVIKCIQFLYFRYNRKIILAGYCMGGILAIGAAVAKSRYIEKLALIATPWNFNYTKKLPIYNKLLLQSTKDFLIDKKIIESNIISSTFTLLNPQKTIDKFIKFSEKDYPEINSFLAVEHWLSNGIAITSKLARQLIDDLIRDNKCYKNQWLINNKIANITNISFPTFISIPKNDYLVPPSSTLPLVKSIKNSCIVPSNAGHIGIIIGRNNKKDLLIPLIGFIKG